MADAIGSALSKLVEVLLAPINFIKDKVGSLPSIKDSIINLPSTIVSAIGSLLKTLFVPSDAFLQEKFNWIQSALKTKVNADAYDSIIKSFKSAKQGQFTDVEIKIMGVQGKILDGSWIRNVLGTFHNWIRGLMFILLIFYNYNQVYKLIRGTDMVGVSNTIEHMKGGSEK